MFVSLQLVVHRFQKHLVGDSSDIEAGFVQDGDDAFVGLLDQVANDAVVEVLDVLPRDSLPQVLFLFLKKAKTSKPIGQETCDEEHDKLLKNFAVRSFQRERETIAST